MRGRLFGSCVTNLTLRSWITDLDREIVSISTFYLDQYLSMTYVDEEVRSEIVAP